MASASPRRRELLATLGVDFSVEASAVDETLEPGPLARAVARLALRKARAVAARRPASLVLAADTIVVVDGEALGKPAGPEEAALMLRRLRGRRHEVMTGVAVVDAPGGRDASDTVTSRVTMKDYSDAQIAAYVGTAEPLDKAGAYAIQGAGGALVDALDGSWSNVVGLPLHITATLLARFGLAVSAPPAE
ncbi:MAG TPA: Maf family protein [Methylomirabilota bacterium]|nr:Maf family protein [Methylomirabilota bacterium]